MERTIKEFPMIRGQLAVLDDGQGQVIRVREGMLWITQEDEGIDHILGVGGTFTIERRGRTLITALGDGLVELLAPHSDSNWERGHGRWLRVFSQLVSRAGV